MKLGKQTSGIFFVYASPEARIRKQQWDYLKARKSVWGPLWVLGGNLNDIKNKDEKKGGKEILNSSFQDLRTL